MNVAICCENITKTYSLYQKNSDYIKEMIHPFRKKYHHDFHALKNVSFNIYKGETVAIIGKNGSGKSTLLKIITGVLNPTSGRLSVNGNISALLELGSGFNPDFTGYENIYFQGSIMGFSKSQMDLMFDEIVAFADIGEYLYQPVRMYSSGMFVRLAFAVSAMVNPEILIVDEALAVGDVRFQQKCIRKMKEIMERGKTVLFVTHDMGVVNNFCTKAVWIDEGFVREVGDTQSITKKYLSYMSYGLETKDEKNAGGQPRGNLTRSDGIDWIDLTGFESFGEMGAVISAASLVDPETSEAICSVDGEKNILLCVRLDVKSSIGPGGAIGFIVKDRLQNHIFAINSYIHDEPLGEIASGSLIVFKIKFKLPLLNAGRYSISLSFSEGTQSDHVQHHWIHDALFFDMLPCGLENSIGNVIGIPRTSVSFEKKIT